MKLKLDEQLPIDLVGLLTRAGHDVDTVIDEGLGGQDDDVVLDRAKKDGRVLLTLDKGIGNIRAYPPADYAGIVLFRPSSVGRAAAQDLISRRFAVVETLDLKGRLVVVSERTVRTR